MTTQNNSPVDGFGEPVHTSERKGFPEGPKKGTTVWRILPPILNQRGSGKYVLPHTCHYGYGIRIGDKVIPKPFYCVEEGKFVNGKFEATQKCPECEAIKLVTGQKDSIEKSMAGQSAVDIAQAVSSLKAWLDKHNRDHKQYVNAKDEAGNYGTKKLPKKEVWSKIKAIIEEKKAESYPIDAIAASQGLWFRITRSGDRFKTEYAVDIVKEDVVVDGKVIAGAQKPKLAPLTAEDAKKASAACFDLADVGIIRFTVDQVQRLVRSKGDQEVVSAIYAESVPVEKAAPAVEPDVEESPVPVEAPPPAPAPQVKPAAPAVTAAPTAAPNVDAVMAQAQAIMAGLQGAPAAAPAAAPVVTTPATAPPPPAKPAAPAPPPQAAPAVPAAAQPAMDEFLSQFALPGQG